MVVGPTGRPYWQLRGWHVENGQLAGFYRTPYGSFAGYIRDWDTNRPEFYIIRPPEALRHHPHWMCFRHRGGGRYFIHFDPPPPNPDAGILSVEEVLTEALEES